MKIFDRIVLKIHSFYLILQSCFTFHRSTYVIHSQLKVNGILLLSISSPLSFFTIKNIFLSKLDAFFFQFTGKIGTFTL